MPVLTIQLNKPVKQLLLAGLLLQGISMHAQVASLSLRDAFALAEQHYPLLGQKELLQQEALLRMKNLNTALLPQLALLAQASYQSDITKIDLKLPGMNIPEQSKDQYKAYADLSQQLYDGGLTRDQKKVQQATTRLEENRVQVELNTLKIRVNQFYFSLLYQQQLLAQANLLLQDIALGINKVKPQVDNGSLLRSNLLLLQAQQLEVEQRKTDIALTSRGLADALAILLQAQVNENTRLEMPVIDMPHDTLISRPELEVYTSQIHVLQEEELLVNARNRPKLSAFAQGGYGRPALNLLSDQFMPYYIAGLRMQWQLGGLYTARREKQLLQLNQKSTDLQQQTFLMNTRSELSRQEAAIKKYSMLVQADGDIIALRKKISDAAKAQLENAVITANDYLKEVNAENQSRQNLLMHQVQLLSAQADYAITTGKL